MEKLNGYLLPFRVQLFEKKVDLIYENGPLLSLYTCNGDYYIFYWVDCDKKINRWMIFRTSLSDVFEYIHQQKSLLNIIENNIDGFVRFADYSGDGKFSEDTIAIRTSDIPKDYLPENDAFFNFGITEEINNIFNSTNYEVNVPISEQPIFLTVARKMGWQPCSI